MDLKSLFSGIDTASFNAAHQQQAMAAIQANVQSLAGLKVEAQFREEIKAILPEKMAWAAESKSIIELGFILSTMTKTIFGQVVGQGVSLPYFYIEKGGQPKTNLSQDTVHEPDNAFYGIWLLLSSRFNAIPVMTLNELKAVYKKALSKAEAAQSEYKASLVDDDEEASF